MFVRIWCFLSFEFTILRFLFSALAGVCCFYALVCAHVWCRLSVCVGLCVSCSGRFVRVVLLRMFMVSPIEPFLVLVLFGERFVRVFCRCTILVRCVFLLVWVLHAVSGSFAFYGFRFVSWFAVCWVRLMLLYVICVLIGCVRVREVQVAPREACSETASVRSLEELRRVEIGAEAHEFRVKRQKLTKYCKLYVVD